MTDRTRDGSDYPRPALGRRPWFALLRRAWILRRFAFAMGGDTTRLRTVRTIACAFDTDGWSSGPILVATARSARRRGLAPAPGPFGLAIAGGSVVRGGVVGAVAWFGIGSDGSVVGAGSLRWIVVCRRARLLVEIPAWVGVPPLGAALRLRPILATWPAC